MAYIIKSLLNKSIKNWKYGLWNDIDCTKSHYVLCQYEQHEVSNDHLEIVLYYIMCFSIYLPTIVCFNTNHNIDLVIWSFKMQLKFVKIPKPMIGVALIKKNNFISYENQLFV